MKILRNIAAISMIATALLSNNWAAAQDRRLPAGANTALSYYIAADGDDNKDGKTPTTAVRTLDRIQKLLRAIPANDKHRSVTVRFRSGVYRGLNVKWNYWRPNTDIVFEPEHPTADGYPVVLDGDGVPVQGFFTLSLTLTEPPKEPVPTNLHFRRLRITNYCEGISFGDHRANVTVSNNSIEDSQLDHMGTVFDPNRVIVNGRSLPKGNCVAAVRVQRAHNTVIRNTSFQDILNLTGARTAVKEYGPAHLHMIYIAHQSMNTLVENNVFERYNGPPIRIRDRSDNTRVLGNRFLAPASKWGAANTPLAAVSQWYCNIGLRVCVDRAAAGRTECPSSGTEIRDNMYSPELTLYVDQSQSTQATCTGQADGAAPVYMPKMSNNLAR